MKRKQWNGRKWSFVRMTTRARKARQRRAWALYKRVRPDSLRWEHLSQRSRHAVIVLWRAAQC
jgi:hypothetical protein